MIKALAMAALLGAPGASPPAPPSAPRCLTRQQVGDLTVVFASLSVEAVRNACRAHLPAAAFLATPAGAEFSSRLRAEGLRRLDSALAGAGRVSRLGPETVAEMAHSVAEAMMAEGVGADWAPYLDAPFCRDANEILEISATLSPDQMARFVSAFASIADHFARVGPPLPVRHGVPPAQMPSPPPPPGNRPAPAPLAFQQPGGREPGSLPPLRIAPPPPSPRGTPGARPPRPPLRPFLCQDGE